jgi:hypothetical protein
VLQRHNTPKTKNGAENFQDFDAGSYYDNTSVMYHTV